MALLQLIVLVLFVWAVITILTMGLFSAPWYVLLVLLVLALGVTRSLMPKETAIALPSAESEAQTVNPEQSAIAAQPIPQTTLIYRGTSYTHTAHAVAHPEIKAASGLQTPPVETSTALIYRGIRVVKSSESASNPS
ncbi:MAG: hypothetical protein HC866_20095 [Leptolyngbyaceae cyanobacterium RU_5_1]|nr:hypothetical protein [Leptolyngbyaceae cyanobacterium RU_5_1]